MSKYLPIFLLMFGSAHACVVGDHASANKAVHFVGLAVVTEGLTVITGKPWIGAATAVALGAYREHWKQTHGYSCETSSIAYDLAGIGVGLWVGNHILLSPQKGGAVVTYTSQF